MAVTVTLSVEILTN